MRPFNGLSPTRRLLGGRVGWISAAPAPFGRAGPEQRSKDRWMQAGLERKRQEGNGRGDAARLEVRGILRRVSASRGRRPCTARLPSTSPEAENERQSGMGSRKTRRTPWPAARCNKLAARIAEETVAVVQDHEGGTGVGGWHRRPEGTFPDGLPPGIEPGVDADRVRTAEGRDEPQERQEQGASALREFRQGYERAERGAKGMRAASVSTR